jgi:hypothetical protein
MTASPLIDGPAKAGPYDCDCDVTTIARLNYDPTTSLLLDLEQAANPACAEPHSLLTAQRLCHFV